MAIEDPIPVGHVALTIAFQRYHGLQHGSLIDQTVIDSFQGHLEKDDLRAKVRDPQTGTEFAIPREAWRGAWYADRIFSSKTILGNENGNEAFRPYAGRTPYVSEKELSALLRGKRTAAVVSPPRATRTSGKRSRPKGHGRFAAEDEPLLAKMHNLVTKGSKGKFLKPNAAAYEVVREVLGNTASSEGGRPAHLRASRDSIAHRLAKQYRDWMRSSSQ